MTFQNDVVLATFIVDELGELPTPDGITQELGERIARMFDGNTDVFEFLDRDPGHWLLNGGRDDDGRYRDSHGRLWHWKLREARDTCDRFFQLLEQPHEEEAAVA